MHLALMSEKAWKVGNKGGREHLDAVDGTVLLVGHHPHQRKGGVAGEYEVATPMRGLRRMTA